jgi:CheY-like chemotaxis protein
VGISGAVQNRIFEPFFTTKEVGRGTGLGLAGVYGFIKAHRGLVRVESKVGSGTAMHLLLPLAEASQQVPEPAEEPGEKQAMPSGRGRVLVVDDEEMVRTFAAKALVSLGYEVVQAPDARSALDSYQEDPDSFELVLMDLILPKTGGDELFARLRKIRPEVRILIMSGYSKQKVVDDLLRSGAQGFLSKPFTLEDLSQRVASEISTPDRPACKVG